MQDVKCNNCGADEPAPLNRGPDLLLNRPGDFRLVRCQACGLIYQNPQPEVDELAQYYPDEYLPYKKRVDELGFVKRRDEQYSLNRRCRQLMNHWQPPGRLLDVGCSTGLFLNAMRAFGWDVEGVELSEFAANYAREQFGLKVATGTLEEALLPGESFDVVTLYDVLEHVIDPKSTLREIHRILKPGGMILLSLPNPDSFEAKLFGSSWVGWDRPRHLHIFSASVLRRYLVEAGFDFGHVESLGGRLGLSLLSFRFYCNARGVSEEWSRRLINIIYNWPLRLLTWPAYRMMELMNRSTVMTVVAFRQ